MLQIIKVTLIKDSDLYFNKTGREFTEILPNVFHHKLKGTAEYNKILDESFAESEKWFES